MTAESLTITDIIEAIHAEILRAGSVRALGDEWGICFSHIYRVVRRQQNPSPSILKRLGIERATVYRRVGN